MKTNESGYARLIANFENLYAHCLGFGAVYNPSYPAIQAAALNSRLGNARSALDAVQLAKTAHDDATNNREILFSGVKKLATRVINALIACNAVQQRIDDARSINRKLNGKRAGSITIAAAYGYIDQNDCAENWQADHLVQSADEIWPIVQHYLQ